MSHKIFALLSFLALSFTANSQNYMDNGFMQNTDMTYVDNIRTVTLHPISDPYGLPILKLNGSDVLVLDFDELSGDFTNYSYTIVHCNHDWTPSDLLKAEYIEGMQNYFMNDYEFSINTYVPYTHYQLSIPNENLRFTKSGNYILIVYQNDDVNDVVITRRFIVFEEFLSIGGEVIRATKLDERMTHQQLNFVLSHSGYEIPNPYIDLNVTILQNGRWDNAMLGLKPKFIRNNQMDFNFDGENSFYGGNEFRNFDTKQLTELTLNIRKSVLDTNYTVFIMPEIPRNTQTYSTLADVNGRFVIRRLNSSNPESEADYAWMDFFLRAEPYYSGDVYVFGQLSDWQVKPRFKLTYDETSKAFRGRILLKQGYYNYQYVTALEGDARADETEIEGSHWQTSNEYTILVYHREIGIRYDRIIGIKQFADQPFR